VTVALSGTADPVDLIPGNPDSVRRDADDLLAEAGRLEEIATSAAGRSIPSWSGTAADAYATRAATEVERVNAVGQVYRWVAETLHCYADVLAWAQRQAAAAITLYATATAVPARPAGRIPNLIGEPVRKQLDPFGRPISGPLRPGALPPDQVKAQATANLDAARAIATQAEQAAADALDALVEGMPDGKWHWDSFFAGAWDWLVDTVTYLAWDTTLIRGVIDPEGYARDAVAMWDGATSTYRVLTTDPLGAPDILLNGQQRRDNPGHWWGGLAPDIALTLAGGYGAISKAVGAVRAARAGSRAAEAAAAGTRAAEGAQAAERITIGPTSWTAEELATLTPGDGPVTFKFRPDWEQPLVQNGVEHLDLANATRIEGGLSDSGRVSTKGDLRAALNDAAEAERARAERAGETQYHGMVVGHGPDGTWTGEAVSRYYQAQYHSVNSSFGGQVNGYPVGFRPTIFQGLLPDGTIVHGTYDWSPG
jgi:hypothetical protein